MFYYLFIMATHIKTLNISHQLMYQTSATDTDIIFKFISFILHSNVNFFSPIPTAQSHAQLIFQQLTMNTVLVSLRLTQEVSSAWLFTWLSASRRVGLRFGFRPWIQSATRKRVRSRLGLLCRASCGFFICRAAAENEEWEEEGRPALTVK